jgi:hypothetical protein
MLDKTNAATQCNVPHSTRDAHRYPSFVSKRIGDLSSNESRSSRDRRFWGIILWNSLGFAKPADGVERAPSFFETIQEEWTCLRSGHAPLVEMPIEVHIRRIEQYHPR